METCMNKIKSFTSIEESKILADILPLESADYYYPNRLDMEYQGVLPIGYKYGNPLLSQEIAAWSLAALLEVMKEPELIRNSEGKWLIRVWYHDYPYSKGGYDNPIDACVSMIEKLHKLNLL